MAKKIAAIKVRGDIDARKKAKRTLKDLNLDKKNQCIVFEDSESVRGMLNVVKDYITFGEVDEDTVEKLEDRNGEELENGETVELSPPSGGFSDTKKQVGQGGSLGERENMDELIERMV
ncbi:MAG: uL30 family ribosomal protein [Candidatus Nanohaloarchaea archaeon]